MKLDQKYKKEVHQLQVSNLDDSASTNLGPYTGDVLSGWGGKMINVSLDTQPPVIIHLGHNLVIGYFK
jgi:hypothetical protein